MTRKDYKRIARAIREAGKAEINGKEFVELADLVTNLCAELFEDNPRFDALRFVSAIRGGQK